jgi:hypothetical protein
VELGAKRNTLLSLMRVKMENFIFRCITVLPQLGVSTSPWFPGSCQWYGDSVFLNFKQELIGHSIYLPLNNRVLWLNCLQVAKYNGSKCINVPSGVHLCRVWILDFIPIWSHAPLQIVNLQTGFFTYSIVLVTGKVNKIAGSRLRRCYMPEIKQRQAESQYIGQFKGN